MQHLSKAFSFGKDANIVERWSTELLIEVLSWLPHVSIVRCREVCQRLKAIVDDSVTLQYIIELSAAGYHTWPAMKNSSTAESLSAFRDIQRIYRSPNPTRIGDRIDLTGLIQWPQDEWVQYLSWKQYGHVLVGFVPAPATEDLSLVSTTIFVLWLDSDHAAERPSRRLYSLRFDDRRTFVDVDAEQNLLILESPPGTLHFLSLLSGEAHSRMESHMQGKLVIPGASQVEIVSGGWVFVSRLARDPLALKFSSLQRRECHLIHWPSGIVRKKWPSFELHSRSVYIISNCLLILSREFHDGDMDFVSSSAVFVYGLPTERSTLVDVSLRAVFQFPGPGRFFDMQRMQPIISYRNDFAPRVAILRLTAWYPLYIPSSVFVPSDSGRNRQAEPHIIAWEDWRHYAIDTYSFEGGDLHRPIASSGLRVICETCILDINPYDVATDLYGPRRAFSQEEGPASPGSTVEVAVAAGVRSEEGKPSRTLRLRLTPHNLNQLWDNKEVFPYFIEERGRPMIICVRWATVNGRPNVMPVMLESWAM